MAKIMNTVTTSNITIPNTTISNITSSSNKPLNLSEGVNFLHYLRIKFIEEMNGVIFSMNSCPYGDIWDEFNKQYKNIKSVLTEIETKINDFESACIELEKLDKPKLFMSDDDTYKKTLYKTKKENIEIYNLTLYTAYICGLCVTSIINVDTKTTDK